MENIATASVNREDDDERNSTWENNHQKIVTFINEAATHWMKPIPTITEIAKATGLSRQTIYTHIKECSTHPTHRQRKELFGMLQFDVLMKVCSSAIGGNIRAARLYLELTGVIQPMRKTDQNITSNTNIQVNGMVINQQVLQSLSPEQLKKIEEIIKPAMETEVGQSMIRDTFSIPEKVDKS